MSDFSFNAVICACPSCGADFMPERDDAVLQGRIPKGYRCPSCSMVAQIQVMKLREGEEDEDYPLASPIFQERRGVAALPPRRTRISDTTVQIERCRPLLNAATPGLYAQNAFRITGLKIDVTSRELKRRVDDLKSAEEFGDADEEHTAAYSLRPPPSLDQIREASQKLQDPEIRLIDEMFWFWPLIFGEGNQDKGLLAVQNGDTDGCFAIWNEWEKSRDPNEQVTGEHNLAVMYHLTALDSERIHLTHRLGEEDLRLIQSYWSESIQRWDHLQDNDLFWDRISERIKQIDDPRLTSGLHRRLRGTFQEALSRIHAQMALDYGKGADFESAERHSQIINRNHADFAEIRQTLEELADPLAVRIKTASKNAVSATMGSPESGAERAFQLLDDTRQPLLLIGLLFPSGHHYRTDLGDEVADACLRCQVQHGKKTIDWETSIQILTRVLELEVSPKMEEDLRRNLGIVENNLAYREAEKLEETYFQRLKQIGDSKHSSDAKIAKITVVVVEALKKVSHQGVMDGLISIAAEMCRSLAIDVANNSKDWARAQRHLNEALRLLNTAKEPDQDLLARIKKDSIILAGNVAQAEAASSAKSKRQWQGCLGYIVVFGVLIIIGAISDCSKSRTSTSTYRPPSTYNPPPAGVLTPAPASNQSFIAAQKTTIEEDRQLIDRQKLAHTMEGSSIESARGYVDGTDAYALQAFNRRVEAYNAEGERLRRAIDAFNAEVDGFNRTYGK